MDPDVSSASLTGAPDLPPGGHSGGPLGTVAFQTPRWLLIPTAAAWPLGAPLVASAGVRTCHITRRLRALILAGSGLALRFGASLDPHDTGHVPGP